MLAPFFAVAAQTPGRQKALRWLVTSHVLIVALAAIPLLGGNHGPGAMALGQTLLIAGIVEGALLVGWRLTQLPKSQALEFLLVSPVRPHLIVLAEALVGLVRFGLVTLSGLPILVLLMEAGLLCPGDLSTLLFLPWIWGAVTGLGLTAWAYEGEGVRRWGERLMVAAILAYLVIGVLAGENLPLWLAFLPRSASNWFMWAFRYFHENNPFGVMKFAMECPPQWTWRRILDVELMGLAVSVLFLGRAAARLHGHFHDRHYRPVLSRDNKPRPVVGDHPLSWWAVKRVSEYSGRINLWLAGGFGTLYAIFTIAQASWPIWLGRQAFEVFDRMGGIPVLATALVLLAGVPAAFQYGLWDSSAQDRCRRLELLLLTRLDALAYWEAAAAAAWHRGKGYFVVALVLWGAGWWAGKVTAAQFLASLAAGVVLWALYFALGFRAFSRGHQANLLGLILTLGLPLLAWVLYRAHWPVLAALLPPGSVYHPAAGTAAWSWLPGPLLGGVAALAIGRYSLAYCDQELRQWYDRHHGQKVMD